MICYHWTDFKKYSNYKKETIYSETEYLPVFVTILLENAKRFPFLVSVVFFTTFPSNLQLLSCLPNTSSRVLLPIFISLMLILNFSSFPFTTKFLETVVHFHLYWTLLIHVSAHSTPGVIFELNENSSYKSYQSLLSNSHIAFFHPPTLFLCGLWYSWPLHTMEKFPLGPQYHCLLALLSVLSLLVLNLQTSK